MGGAKGDREFGEVGRRVGWGAEAMVGQGIRTSCCNEHKEVKRGCMGEVQGDRG